MNNQKIIYGVSGLVLGGILVFLGMGMLDNKGEVSVKQESSTHSSMSMSAMNEALENKTGDEFDKAFIELMTEHHQGAIDMANLIETRAKHQEIKDLGKAIITAQMKEIQEMSEWAKSWGYVEGKESLIEKDDSMESGMMAH